MGLFRIFQNTGDRNRTNGACFDPVNKIEVEVSSEYNRSQLNPSEKELYDLLLQAILDFKNQITCRRDIFRDSFDFMKIYAAVKLDNPKIFWSKPGQIRVAQSASKIIIFLEYDYSKSDAEQMMERIDSKIETILSECRLDRKKEYQQSLSIYEYITKNVEYIDEGSDSHTIIGPLLKGKGVCEGIALSMKYILDRCGIKCDTICGKVKNGSGAEHAWNIVCIDGRYCHQDVTQDLKNKTHIYFNLTDSEISATHEFKKVLDCSSDELGYYRKNRLYLTPDKAKEKILYLMQNLSNSIEVKLTEPVDPSSFSGIAIDSELPVPEYNIRYLPNHNVILFRKK